MSWLKEVIGTEKAIIAMCHMQAMPGDPGYDGQKGMDWVIKNMYDDLIALQNGGVDSVMFSNEFSLPYIVLLEYFSAAFFRFFAPVEYYDPRKKGLFHPYSDT